MTTENKTRWHVVVFEDGDSIQRDGWDPSAWMRCPVCKEGFIEAGAPYVVPGHDGYQAWRGRHDLTVIPFTCEEGHGFEICFGAHKGNTIAFWRPSAGAAQGS